MKEKVSPVKKGMNMNEIIIYFRFPLYDDLSSDGMLLSHRAWSFKRKGTGTKTETHRERCYSAIFTVSITKYAVLKNAFNAYFHIRFF